MNFNKGSVMYHINSIPVIGNYDSGCVIGLTPEGEKFCKGIFQNGVEDEAVGKENAELYGALKSAGFFAENQNTGLVSAYLHVTQRCNLHCIGCYSLDEQRNCLKDAATAQIKRAIGQLAKNGCMQMVISGGEPFLRQDLAEILAYAHDTAQIRSVNIITNGTALSLEKAKQVKPYVDSIAVSIDGYSKACPTFIRDEGIYDQVIEAVEICKQAGIDVSILPTIHTKNYNNLREYVTLSKQLSAIAQELVDMGLQEVVSFQDMPIGEGFDTRKSCEVGHRIVSVGADGTVYPCHMLHDKKLAMGNIFEEELADILTSGIAKECRELHVDHFDTCGDCRHKYVCGGGCRARSFYVYGDLQSHDFYCPMTKTYFDWISNQLEEMYQPA